MKLNSCNPLNSDCHTFVSDYCKRYGINFTPKELQFIEVAYDKHKLTGEYFSYSDFPYLTRNNFSQLIHRINNKTELITKQISGKYPMFSLNGVYLDQTVREKRTGVNNSFINQKIEQLYSFAMKQPPFIHDIKLSSMTSQLYAKLLETGLTPHPNNKQFIIPIHANPRFTSKAQISPNGRMDLHVGCSQQPIPCSIDGFSELFEYIGEVKYFLTLQIQSMFTCEPAYNWIFEYYHFNRDSEPIVDSSYKFSLGQHNDYCYIKKFDNGIVKARFEEKRTPKKSIKDEEYDVLKSQGFFCP